MIFTLTNCDNSCFFIIFVTFKHGTATLRTVRELNSVRKSLYGIFCDFSVKLCNILLVHMLFRRGYAVRKVTVICNKKQSLCVTVKSAHGKKSLSFHILGDNINNSLKLPVLGCRHNSRRLVHHYIYVFAVIQSLSVHNNFILVGINLCIGLFADFSVHKNRTAFYELLNLFSAVGSL